MACKKVGKENIFEIGEIVEVNGDTCCGIAKVIHSWPFESPEDFPRGELSYYAQMNEPFPQVGVQFEDGRKVHFNADDLLAGKIKRTKEKIKESDFLCNILSKLKVDYSPAYRSLGEIGGDETEIKTLAQILFHSSLMKFIAPLNLTKIYYPSVDEVIVLDEFDSFTYEFRSVKEGVAMRNSGKPGFILEITVDGYAPTTMELKINETFYKGWGEEE